MNQLAYQLSQTKLFQNIAADQLSDSLPQLGGSLRRLLRGEILVNEGERIDYTAAILSGKISVQKLYPDGRISLIELLKPGYTLGALTACSATQISPWTMVADIPSEIFMFPICKILDSGQIDDSLRQLILKNVISFMANENIKKQYKIEVLSYKSARDRIYSFLEIYSRKKGSRVFDIPFDRSQFADYLCMNRSVLSHELSRMEEDGLIRFKKSSFELL